MRVFMNNPLMSIVCVSLNNPEYLDLMLKGLQKNTVNSFEVLVHGNMAGEEFDAVIEKYKDIISVYTKSKENQSIAKPLNDLFSQTKGEILCFMDDDMYLAPGWDEALLRKVKPDMIFQYLCVVSYIHPKYHNVRLGGRSKIHNLFDYGTTAENFREDEFNRTWKERRTILADHSIPTGNFLVKRELYGLIGGRNEGSNMGGDREFIMDVYDAAIQANQPVEFRSVADSCAYHFNHIGSAKPASKELKYKKPRERNDQHITQWALARKDPHHTWQKILELPLHNE